MSSKITVTIDSDLPYLCLPDVACNTFERAFGLSLDADRDLYLLNDTVHGDLRKSNPSIRFSLGKSLNEAVNVTLPYLAFDLQVTQPIAENGTNYFPLRCSSDASRYVLGRAFLQEAYLFADYESSSFSLSQANLTTRSNIVTISHSSRSPTSTSQPDGPDSAGLSRGSIAGIAIGSSMAVALLLSLFFFLFRKSCPHRQVENTNRSSISGPIPCDGGKVSWPNSPTGSGTDNIAPPMASTSNGESPFQRFEERLERLERANTTRFPESAPANHRLRSEVSGEEPPSWTPTMTAKKQELAGSPTAKELQDARFGARGRQEHVFELAADASSWMGSKR